MAWGPQPHQIGNLALVRGSGPPAAKLLARRWLLADTSLVVLDGCTWISVRTEGPGGASVNNGYAGGGGAFAREDRVCKSGQSISAVVPLGATGARRPSTSVSLDGVTICLAVSGIPATSGSSGTGGLAADCIGTVRYSGGRGSNSGGAAPTGGENGGAPGLTFGASNLVEAGGGAAGERNALDALILGGRGANASTGPEPYDGRGEFPGGGAATDRTQNGSVSAPGGDGVAVIEFWSAKP